MSLVDPIPLEPETILVELEAMLLKLVNCAAEVVADAA